MNKNYFENDFAVGSPKRTIACVEQYQARGWAPFPAKPRSKEPLRKGWQTTTSGTNTDDFGPNCNVAMNLGDPSGGLVVVDLDCQETILAAQYLLPKTGLSFGRESNPKSHWAYYVSSPDRKQAFSSPGDGVLVEYLGTGSCCLFPPSVYENGEKSVFHTDGEPSAIGREELLRSVGKVAACALLSKHWPEGNRHSASMALAGTLALAGWSESETQEFVLALCRAARDEEFGDRLTAIKTSYARAERQDRVVGLPSLATIVGDDIASLVSDWLGLSASKIALGHNGPPPDEQSDIGLTEIGNADRFISQWGNDARYCSELKSWFVWRGGRWEHDKTDRVSELADRTARSIYSEASEKSDSRDREQIVKWASKSCSQHGVGAMLELAKPKLSFSVENFDSNRLLLNFRNGTVDLTTGRIREHRREDWITKQIPHVFNPNAESPRFLQFLEEITLGDGELIDFLTRSLGYSLTGLTDAQCMFIAYGDGANGKSTLLELFQDLLGDYSKSTPVQTFLAKKGDGGASDDLARLRGARYVTMSEGEADHRLAEALLKRVTGGDQVTARHLYGSYFDYKPNFKLWMSTNNRLKISGTDNGIWRRIHEIPFDAYFPKGDPTLPEKLRSEAEGILAWAVRGCLSFLEGGLNVPARVKKATDSYREEMDVVGQFLTERVTKCPSGRLLKGDLYQDYLSWVTANGLEKISKSALGKRLKLLGYKDGKSGSVLYWVGIALLTEDAPGDGVANVTSW